jgi:hypothetical protein
MLSAVAVDAEIEFVTGQMLKKLFENSLAGMHWYPPVMNGRYHPERIQIEKRTVVSKNNTN